MQMPRFPRKRRRERIFVWTEVIDFKGCIEKLHLCHPRKDAASWNEWVSFLMIFPYLWSNRQESPMDDVLEYETALPSQELWFHWNSRFLWLVSSRIVLNSPFWFNLCNLFPKLFVGFVFQEAHSIIKPERRQPWSWFNAVINCSMLREGFIFKRFSQDGSGNHSLETEFSSVYPLENTMRLEFRDVSFHTGNMGDLEKAVAKRVEYLAWVVFS